MTSDIPLHIRYVLPDQIIVVARMPLTTPVPLPGETVHVNGQRCVVVEREWSWSDGLMGVPALSVDVKLNATGGI